LHVTLAASTVHVLKAALSAAQALSAVKEIRAVYGMWSRKTMNLTRS